ncbi:hypothetical protein E2C01_048273 [Portunus trituberculatus]|uniref:Uncharacterized protein n=1 Tax=Portunus trituberculatus TaxID=210409 RepID=A0A5B7G5Z2_PORTR|nr:hypothetical protein [Portunus trituberculatus]
MVLKRLNYPQHHESTFENVTAVMVKLLRRIRIFLRTTNESTRCLDRCFASVDSQDKASLRPQMKQSRASRDNWRSIYEDAGEAEKYAGFLRCEVERVICVIMLRIDDGN